MKEIATLNGATEGAIKVQMHRIYENLRKLSGIALFFFVLTMVTKNYMKPNERIKL